MLKGDDMQYKSILLNASGTQGGSQALNMALDLAKHFGAHLTGLYVYATAYSVYEYAQGAVSTTLEGREEDARIVAERTVNAFQSQAGRVGGIDSDWICIDGDPFQELTRCARSADLLFIPPSAGFAPAAPASADLPAELAVASGCPVLFVPEISRSSALPRRILIACNASREAMRAVRDALPLLATAQSIEILTIKEDTEHVDEHPGAAAQTLLRRHGISSQLSPAEKITGSVSESILSRAEAFGAELICMGAYGHPRLLEFALGRVTRHMLRQTTLPVLMSH